MTNLQIVRNMAADYGSGFWDGNRSPCEIIAEFQGTRPASVTIAPSGRPLMCGKAMSDARLEMFVLWLCREYSWIIEMNGAWTLPVVTPGKAVA